MKKPSAKIIIKQVIMMSVLTLVLASSLFAWFARGNIDYPIIFKTGHLDVYANLYDVLDDDEEILEPLTINNVVSGDEFIYRLEVKSDSSIKGKLVIDLEATFSEGFDKVFDFYYKINDGNESNRQDLPSFINLYTNNEFDYEGEVEITIRIVVNGLLTNDHFGDILKIERIFVSLEQVE